MLYTCAVAHIASAVINIFYRSILFYFNMFAFICFDEMCKIKYKNELRRAINFVLFFFIEFKSYFFTKCKCTCSLFLYKYIYGY